MGSVEQRKIGSLKLAFGEHLRFLTCPNVNFLYQNGTQRIYIDFSPLITSNSIIEQPIPSK